MRFDAESLEGLKANIDKVSDFFVFSFFFGHTE